MTYPAANDPTEPRTPGLARRLLLAVLVAALLGAGTTLAVRYATTDHHHPAVLPSPTASVPTDPPYEPVVVTPSPASTPPSPSPSRRPSRRPSTPQPSRSAVPSPSPSPVPLFQVPTKGLCTYVDWTPIRDLKLVTKPSEIVGSGVVQFDDTHKQYQCKGNADGVALRPIGARFFDTRQLADSTWVTENDDMDAGLPIIVVPGLGDRAWGLYISQGGRSGYTLEILDSNLILEVVMTNPKQIAPARIEEATAAVARALLARLPRA